MSERILTALREAGEPVSPGDLAKKVGLASSTTMRYHLKPLIAAGQVVEAGRTNALRFSLPGADKPSPKAPTAIKPSRAAAATSPAPTGTTPDEARVQARDRAIVDRLKVGRATLEELLAVLPDEPGLASADRRTVGMKAVRRLIIRGRVADVGERFALVGA